tara:strand:+ start:847 stop:1293 length:447 start_codon:yes stop_codon:yes gene_type:complete
MIRFLIYIYVAYLLFKKLFNVLMNYKEYYSQKKIKLNLVKVVSDKAKTKGLMHRKRKLQNGQGMLFVYKKPQNISMWMKNTYIPLDVLFLNKDYIVEDIKHNMKPHNTKSYRSKKKCKYAIEINGGESRDNNIKIGTRVIPNIIRKLN